MGDFSDNVEKAQLAHLKQSLLTDARLKERIDQHRAQMRGGHLLELVRVAPDRSRDLGVNLEPILEQELDCPNHATRIVREDNVGIIRATHRARLQVLQAATGQVDDFGLVRTIGQVVQSPKQRIERELTAHDVLLDRRRLDRARLVAFARVAAVALLAGIGDFDHFAR